MTPAAPRRLVAVGCAAVTLLAVLAGCGSDGGTVLPTSSAPVTSPPDTEVTTPTASDTPSSSPSDSPTPTASGTPATTPPTGTPTSSPALAICADLGVTVTRVPGAAGVTYGLVSVTNRGATRCSLPGVPSLRLLDAARSPMTATATADSTSGGVTALDPGAVASTLLEDRSATCQANTRSTYVEVQATTAAATVVAALALPPCSLSVKPFVPGTSPAP